MKVRILLLLAAQLFAVYFSKAQTLRGEVVDTETGRGLPGVRLQLLSEQDTLSGQVFLSDESGQFDIEGLRPGYFRLEVSCPGYQTRYFRAILVSAGKETTLECRLQAASLPLPDIVVTAPGGASTQPLGALPLTREQNLRFPNTYYDPARLAQVFAGVANADDQANGLSIRGNSPAAVRWRLEGVDVVNPNHLSNAGTFSDRPASASGGVLMFSAQLLDNSSLLTGAFPAGYGDALGGIMDIRLRNGNNRQHEFTAQAGLIGLDLAAEGPLSKNGNSAYLANYRYSTVGLLGQMGVSFGDEQINFQDFSAKLNFQNKKLGRWSLFAMAGQSENNFTPKQDSAEIAAYKDFFDIQFRSRTGIAGISGETPLSAKTGLQWSAVASAQDNRRNSQGLGSASDDENLEWRLGYRLALNHRFSRQLRLQTGINHQRIFFDQLVQTDSFQTRGEVTALQWQPWARMEWRSNSDRWLLSAGVHALFYTFSHDRLDHNLNNYEPRIMLRYRAGQHHQIALAYSRQSQALPYWFFIFQVQEELTSPQTERLGLIRMDQMALRHSWQLAPNWTLNTEGFLQQMVDVPVGWPPDRFNWLNVSEFQQERPLQATGLGYHYGLELGLERSLSEGWFLLANATFLQTDYRDATYNWRPGRWDFGQMINLTAGKEWERREKGDLRRTFGVNGRLNARGGFRDRPIDLEASRQRGTTVYANESFDEQLPAFFRLDARVYWRRHLGNRRNATFAMEFQNLTMQQNVAYRYYDHFTRKIETKYQLGLIPNLSWRLEF